MLANYFRSTDSIKVYASTKKKTESGIDENMSRQQVARQIYSGKIATTPMCGYVLYRNTHQYRYTKIIIMNVL